MKRFRDFPLTRESLASRDSFEKYLQSKQEEGALKCAKLNVIDMQARREILYAEYNQNPIIVKPMSKLTHELIGFAYTFTSNAKNSWSNRRARSRISNKPMFCRRLRSALQRLRRFR